VNVDVVRSAALLGATLATAMLASVFVL